MKRNEETIIQIGRATSPRNTESNMQPNRKAEPLPHLLLIRRKPSECQRLRADKPEKKKRKPNKIKKETQAVQPRTLHHKHPCKK